MFDEILAGSYNSEQFYDTQTTPERRVYKYEMEILEWGEGACFINGIKYPHMPGSLLFAKPGDVRFTTGRFRCVFFKFRATDSVLCAALDALPSGVFCVDASALRICMEKAMPLCRRGETGAQLALRGTVYEAADALYHLLHREQAAVQVHGRYFNEVLKAKAYMDEHYASKINLDQLAKITFLSKNFLRVQFERSIGISPHAYLKKVRLAQAKQRLKATQQPLSEIAVSCGFDSQAYMNYCFKKEMGISPLQYKKGGSNMVKLVDKLWNWGHLEGSHNAVVHMDCKMTPEGFAEEYGIKNSFIVSYGGNIQPPYDALAKRLSGLGEIKWSVLGDASTPLPEAELGNTQDILDVLSVGKNITGGVVDDFFAPERMKRFTPEVLKKIKKALNEKGLDFWCVLYDNQLDFDLEQYIECFDGVSFWIWKCENIANMETYLEKLFSLAKGKQVMLGTYLWDYSEEANCPMDAALFEKQIKAYFELLTEKKIDGVIVCSNTIGDADLETNRILKKYIELYGDTEIE